MEFEEVQNLIREETTAVRQKDHAGTNAYESLMHNNNNKPVVRKPTFSNFVHRLKQQSSKTRFVRDYQKMANSSDDPIDEDVYLTEDHASIRIIDPTRELARDTEEQEEEEEEEEQVIDLGIRQREKRPLKKRVKIDESANQIQGLNLDTDTIASFELPKGDITSNERFVTFEVAMGMIHQDISDTTDNIYKQMKRIEMNRDEITRYKQDLFNMQKQLDFFYSSLVSMRSDEDHVNEMISHQMNTIKNIEKLKENKKRNAFLKSRFDRYRKAISIDTKLFELEKKIKAAWKRDDIWAAIRDWGFLSVLVLTFVITFIITWQQQQQK